MDMSLIVGQLDVLTQTMSLLEERLTMNEDKVNRIVTIIGGVAVQVDACFLTPRALKGARVSK